MNKISGGNSMFNSNNTPFTMPVMPATGNYADGAGAWGGEWLWIIVVFAFMGLNDIIPIFTTNTVDLVLLAVLFVVSGVRLFPEKKLCTYIYFGVALLMLGILAVGFML